MAKAKLAVTFDVKTLTEVDLLVKRHLFSNRSRLIEEAVVEKLARLNQSRLARECALLDPVAEKYWPRKAWERSSINGPNIER